MQSNSNAAPALARGPLARLLVPNTPGPAANDNGDEPVSAAMLEASLRHFAAHGLGAARAARQQAEQAFFAGDQKSYRWWLGICRLLDRRMALIAAREFETEQPQNGG